MEEPLEIRVNGDPLTVTMRTPGDDLDLAIGFLATERVVGSPDGIVSIKMCDENAADITLVAGLELLASRVRRNFITTSACGVCGKESIAAIRVQADYDISADPVVVDPAVLVRLPGRPRRTQRVFSHTSGLHAAGLFRADGTLLAMREDVGRHNAVDKIVGWALRRYLLPLRGCLRLVIGRASFELAQKTLMADIPVLAAVSAPSSLAAELAQEAGMTLVGFLRGTSMNVCARTHRPPP